LAEKENVSIQLIYEIYYGDGSKHLCNGGMCAKNDNSCANDYTVSAVNNDSISMDSVGDGINFKVNTNWNGFDNKVDACNNVSNYKVGIAYDDNVCKMVHNNLYNSICTCGKDIANINYDGDIANKNNIVRDVV